VLQHNDPSCHVSCLRTPPPATVVADLGGSANAMKIVMLLVITLTCAGCMSERRRPHEYWEQQLTEIAPAYHEQISLIQLIANPRAFKDHYVRVEGYLNMEFERDRLFLHKIDRDEWLESNGVSIGICSADTVKKLRALSDHYVFIEGKVWYQDGAVTIWNITRVERSGLPEIVLLSIEESRDSGANEALRPTTTAVTPPAGQEPRQP